MNQNLLVALLIITLVVNVILGVELYSVLHPPSNAINVTHSSQLLSSTSNSGSTVIMTMNTSYSNTSVEVYSFSYTIHAHIHVREEGKYVIQIQPTGFKELFIVIYFPDGKAVELSLNNTQAIVELDKKGDITITLYIYGESYMNLTEEQVLQNINLNITAISESESD